MLKLTLDYNPAALDNKVIRDGIIAFNTRTLNATDESFSIFLKDDSDVIRGGVLCWLDRDSVYIDVLWIEDDWRGKDYGSLLMQAVEAEALKHGCCYCTVDTFGFQAEEFYLKNGYERMGEIRNYIREHSRIFLRKVLK